MALILLDLDGTILKEGQIQTGVVEAIQKMKENNHTVAIASGRSPIFLDDLDKHLGVDKMILANGSFVKVDGKVIRVHSFPENVVKKMMQKSDEMGFDLGITYIDDYTAYRRKSQNVDAFSDIYKLKRPKLDRKFYPGRTVFAMLVFDIEKIPTLEKEVPELGFHRSNTFGFDVNLKGDMKAGGAKILMDYLGFKPEEVYAFGDGINDMSMIKMAGNGVAMGNAYEELKNVADYVTTNVDDFGVINGLKHFNLI